MLSVVEKINDPRYPSFKGIMAAKSKPVTTLALADLGLSADEVGLAAATTAVDSFEVAPPRSGRHRRQGRGQRRRGDRRVPGRQEAHLSSLATSPIQHSR